MSGASNIQAESRGSIVGSALLYGCGILMMLLAAMLMGWIAALDALLIAWLETMMNEEFVNVLPAAIIWLMTILLAIGLPLLLLSCAHPWQYLTVWTVSLAAIALWAPVLCLASYRPEISTAWLAAVLSGLLVNLHLYWMSRNASGAP